VGGFQEPLASSCSIALPIEASVLQNIHELLTSPSLETLFASVDVSNIRSIYQQSTYV